mmetsp:Transcript_22201/g.31241  ORF Transcript_22201/g.31241 Transcript_22201/m.31241 type:complete len:924 (-) Transcript_22201:197-2968(-)
MSLSSPQRHITILERETHAQQTSSSTSSSSSTTTTTAKSNTGTTVGSFAAAGMLAPQSERLPSGPLLDLCMESRDMYIDFIQTLEELIQKCTPEASHYLYEGKTDVGYRTAGGFLAPAFAGDGVATWAPPSSSGVWLDATQVRELEPQLHPDVVGGWWFPEDASVDARRLTCALRAACIERGIELWEGKDVLSLDLRNGSCRGIRLNDGRVVEARSVLVANGSWMRNLLPVPISPHKGQSLALKSTHNLQLNRVLFAQDTYIVPKSDGRIIIGATVEPGTFSSDITPRGILHCLDNACRLLPSLRDLPIEEMWVGMRPTTPDKGPILGHTPWKNLYLAGGYWRNGVLLAPKTAQLVGDLILNNPLSAKDQDYLHRFAWNRFTERGGGEKLAADARYAASMHPVHNRSSGDGVSSSVGTELGFYGLAQEAKQERQRDRDLLRGFSNLEDNNNNPKDAQVNNRDHDDYEALLEKAAMMGKSDASAFTLDEKSFQWKKRTSSHKQTKISITNDHDNYDNANIKQTIVPKGNQETLEPPSQDDDNNAKTTATVTIYDYIQTVPEPTAHNLNGKQQKDLNDIYESIRQNKQKHDTKTHAKFSENKDLKPDPGFRIYKVLNSQTGERIELPPYTPPPEPLTMPANIIQSDTKIQKNNYDTIVGNSKTLSEIGSANSSTLEDTYDETTFDGYQTIQTANSSERREDELDAMKRARMANRNVHDDGDGGGQSSIDLSKIGVFSQPSQTTQKETSKGHAQKEEDHPEAEGNGKQHREDLSVIYAKIKSNKHKAADLMDLESTLDPMDDSSSFKSDPGFRIYHVDKDTREMTEIPPYTTPGDIVSKNNDNKQNAVEKTLDRPNYNNNNEKNDNHKSKMSQNEGTYDGYQDILEANGSASREEELEVMREMRQQNRRLGDKKQVDNLNKEKWGI